MEYEANQAFSGETLQAKTLYFASITFCLSDSWEENIHNTYVCVYSTTFSICA